MRQFPALVLVALALSACTGPSGGSTTASAPPSPAASAAETPSATDIGTPVPFVPSSTAAITAAPSRSFKAGPWPPEWQFWICSARAQMLREDAKAGARAGEDAATQAIADLKRTTINWDPGADLRALIGKAAFILEDAAPRPGNAMADVPPAIKAFERAYSDLRDSTGFECP